MQRMKAIVQCCVLGLMLLGLWGCGQTATLEVEALQPSDQWQTLQTSTVQLELPPGYVGGEPGRQLAELQATLTEWGFGDRTEWLAQNADKIDLLAFQPNDNHLNSINVVQESPPADLTPQTYLEQQQNKLQAAGVKSELQRGTLGDYLQVTTENLSQSIYVYPTDATLWVITYSNGASRGTENLQFAAQIERMQRSFQVRPEST